MRIYLLVFLVFAITYIEARGPKKASPSTGPPRPSRIDHKSNDSTTKQIKLEPSLGEPADNNHHKKKPLPSLSTLFKRKTASIEDAVSLNLDRVDNKVLKKWAGTFVMLDVDNDLSVTLDELIAAFENHDKNLPEERRHSRDSIVKTFKAFDLDNNDHVFFDEFFLERHRHEPHRQHLEHILSIVSEIALHRIKGFIPPTKEPKKAATHGKPASLLFESERVTEKSEKKCEKMQGPAAITAAAALAALIASALSRNFRSDEFHSRQISGISAISAAETSVAMACALLAANAFKHLFGCDDDWVYFAMRIVLIATLGALFHKRLYDQEKVALFDFMSHHNLYYIRYFALATGLLSGLIMPVAALPLLQTALFLSSLFIGASLLKIVEKMSAVLVPVCLCVCFCSLLLL